MNIEFLFLDNSFKAVDVLARLMPLPWVSTTLPWVSLKAKISNVTVLSSEELDEDDELELVWFEELVWLELLEALLEAALLLEEMLDEPETLLDELIMLEELVWEELLAVLLVDETFEEELSLEDRLLVDEYSSLLETFNELEVVSIEEIDVSVLELSIEIKLDELETLLKLQPVIVRYKRAKMLNNALLFFISLGILKENEWHYNICCTWINHQ